MDLAVNKEEIRRGGVGFGVWASGPFWSSAEVVNEVSDFAWKVEKGLAR